MRSPKARGLYIDKEFDALAEVIHAQDPDFISINEVDSATNRSKGTIHTAELCKRLTALSGGKNQWRWNYAVAFQFGTPGAYSGVGTYGDAVLTKHAILESLGISVSTVNNQIHKALKILRSELCPFKVLVYIAMVDYLTRF